jgi:metallophosphoesterase (TIGR00282 family)
MGLETIEAVLPKVKREKSIDVVIAQAENVTDGRGIIPRDLARLRDAGVDFCTGGNWSLYHKDIFPALNDPAQPIIRPANYPEGTAGRGWKYLDTPAGKVLVISLLGHIVGRDAEKPTDNPLKVVDTILNGQLAESKIATIVNFHGDFSSEKVIIGQYLDGRVTAIVGDHWHVPTADYRVLDKGTAHVSDVGMCGALNSSLGISFASVIPRWRDDISTRNVLETNGAHQFNAVLVVSNEQGLADSIEQVRVLY